MCIKMYTFKNKLSLLLLQWHISFSEAEHCLHYYLYHKSIKHVISSNKCHAIWCRPYLLISVWWWRHSSTLFLTLYTTKYFPYTSMWLHPPPHPPPSLLAEYSTHHNDQKFKSQSSLSSSSTWSTMSESHINIIISMEYCYIYHSGNITNILLIFYVFLIIFVGILFTILYHLYTLLYSTLVLWLDWIG